jgi:hypothetical protein
MDDFTLGYLHASVWSLTENEIYRIPDIAPATCRRMEADCQRFQQENAQVLMQFREAVGWNDPAVEYEALGADFWFARNLQKDLPYLNYMSERMRRRGTTWSEFVVPFGQLWKIVDCVEDESFGAFIEEARRWGEFSLYVGKDNKIYYGDGQSN